MEEDATLEENPEDSELNGEGKEKMELPVDMYYKYDELHSRPYITPRSDVAENLLHFSHSFGYDSKRRANLQLLDNETLIFIAGNILVLLDMSTKEQTYLRSCSGGGIGCIMVHPSKMYFAAGEKGNQPNIIVYEYPSLQPYRILRGGTERAYSYVDFNCDGTLLASIGSAPDYMLVLWEWRQEQVMMRSKAVSQDVYRVSFSPYNKELLTSSGSGHIKFWKIASSFTGPKLQGFMGNFGLTPATDIEGFMELPDGKVLSGTNWGNLLLWDRRDIKVEFCRKGGQTCHTGTIQPFALEDGQLFTIGSDGVVRCWDFEMISSADSHGDNRYCELEPLNELVVGRNVCLSSMVKSFLPDSMWFAQDSNGAIWKLDLSFTNTTIDPECLFTFPTAPIQGLDVSKKSHLMATTTLDHSVNIFDFLEKRELTTLRFNQGGTALIWAPLLVNPNGCLLVSGFEDGVVRLLELYNPQKLCVDTGRSPTEDAKLLLKQAFKPHDAAVTALAYERNGEILATGSADCTVFFLSAGEKYEPIGFIHVPGIVQALEWSPHSHHDNRLLILCQNGHVVEVPRPESKAQQPTKTFQLFDLPSRSFRFRSIKSHIKREEEIARRKAIKEKKKKEKEEQLKESETPDAENEKEHLPPIYIPDPPSPLCCGFYSQPGQFWLSMGGFDSGYLYHCKFSEKQNEDPEKQLDEPFDFLPVHNADDDPIQHITFSSNRKLLLCGMRSGSIRVYRLQPDDRSITSMKAYWSLNVHDNDYGHLRHICCSHDTYFVLTAGDDGNIFSFSLLPPEELQKRLQKKRAKVPLPRVGLETETPAQDIEDPAAHCMETAKQKLHKDYLRQAAEFKHHEKSRKLAEVQKKYDEVLKLNQSLPECVRLQSEELQLDPGFYEHIERMKADRLMEVRKQLAWEQERSSLAFNKLLDWFRNLPETSVVTVVAIRTNLRVSTYSMLVFSKTSDQQSRPGSPDGDRDVPPELSKSQTCKKQQQQADDDKTEEEEVPPPPETKPRIKLGRCHMERLKREAERAEQARAKIEKRKQEWAQLYAEKPDENYEDPQDVQAIRADQENIADLKRASDVTVTTNLRMLAERKREELTALRENIHIKHMEMNGRIVALRDSKLRLVSWLHAQAHQLQKIQECLPIHLHLSPMTLPNILPEETPEKWLQCKLTDLNRYLTLREQRRHKGMKKTEEDICLTTCKIATLLEHMKKEIEFEEEKAKSSDLCDSSVIMEEKEGEEEVVSEAAELRELEEELQKEQEIRLLFEQDSLLQKMESAVSQFDMELLLLHNQKLRLDFQTKLADLCQLTFSQEIQLINQFKKREGSLQENLNKCIMEENRLRSEQEECKDQMKLKQKEIARLHEKEKGLLASLQKALAEDNTFEEFLIKVFKKKIKRVKIKEQTGDKEQEEESDEESDEDDWDNGDDFDDFGSTLEMEAVVDDSVCPSGCNEELFDYVLKLRESRLELEDHISEEKKSAEALKGECEALIKKERVVKSSRKAVEYDLELVNREIQEKMNQLDVVVPLRLHQIQCASGGGLPSGRTELLVHNSTQNKLKQRITELHMETNHQGDLHSQSEQQHGKLVCSHRSMALEIQELEQQCSELMISKFGKLVDLDALQLQSGNRKLEELKQEKLLKEAEYDNQLKNLEAKEEQARDYLHEVTKRNTELLRTMTSLTDEKIKLSHKFKARQHFMGKTQYLDQRRRETQDDILRLEEMEKRQSQQMKILKREIDLLSGKASQGDTGEGGRLTRDRACKWMEVLKEDREGQPAERRRKLQSSDQTPADGQTKHTTWSQTLRWLQPWYSLAPVGVVWSVSQLEALLLHSSLSLGGVCWRMLLLCFLWIVLGGCIHALKCCLRPGRSQGEPLQRQQQEVVSENQHSQIFQSRSPSLHIPLILALADSLLLCVLQEPLPDPSVPHIQALLSRLESVFHTLQKAGIDSEVDPGSILTDKLKLMFTYLNQRIGTLRTLIKVQGDFEASVKDMLQGLGGLWAQLEELHARVTLTKQGNREQVAVASVQTDAESLFTVLGQYRKGLESCQSHLKDSTHILQELTWSHTHTSNKVNSSMESVWPELLLQANIEQFDKVQESFHSLEQQTSTFQAHLEGLRKANQNGHTEPSSQAKDARTETHVYNGSTSDVSLERSSSAASSVSSVEADIETETPLSLCERSALQFSSTFGRLRKSGRRN